MVSPLKNILNSQTVVMFTLGLLPLVGVLATPTPVRAQQRPAITTQDDRILVHSMIKSSLISLNHANQARDYSFLRKLASSDFQRRNVEEELTRIFRPIRDANIDFSVITEYDPVFLSVPALDERNNLVVTGYFPTTPRIDFEMTYQFVNGAFRVDTLSLGIRATAL
jgi:hypothetical protein